MSTLAELNVTPMLDLAFVLLIIFMITAPLLASRVDLIIPTTRAKRDAVAAERTVIVEMNNEGVLEIEGDVMTEQDLKQRLAEQLAESPELGVLIRADASLSLGKVMPVLDLLKSEGIVDVGFMARSDP
ncbi:MAG: protein TolR [Verrucomicrobiaceae bacterium]|jgi:biopolymer transport protein ExbD|nr:biopolymer transporter ExbD [Verrucomicrobiales bacterium]NCF94684.1 protein TolR [Verrucomicrobiaceae bacterium]